MQRGATSQRAHDPTRASRAHPISASATPIIRAMRNQLRPLFDRVVIKELDPDRVRRSGLLVPPGLRRAAAPARHRARRRPWPRLVGARRRADARQARRPRRVPGVRRRVGRGRRGAAARLPRRRAARRARARRGLPRVRRAAAGRRESCPVCGREGSIASRSRRGLHAPAARALRRAALERARRSTSGAALRQLAARRLDPRQQVGDLRVLAEPSAGGRRRCTR